MPGEDDDLKQFIKAVTYDDNDKILLEAAKNGFSKEIKVLERTGENLADKVKTAAERIVSVKKDENTPVTMDNTTPMLSAEQIENRLMSTNIDAAGSVFRPSTPTVEKKSSFFSDVKYDVSLSDIEAKKKINSTTNVGTDVDFFDKTATLNYQQIGNGGYTKFSAGAGYNPFKNRLKVDLRYSMPRQYLRGRVYLQENNSGINGEYGKVVGKNATINFKAGVFKNDAAFEMEYNKKRDKSKVTLGVYGTTKYHEVGVYGRIGL